MQNRDELILSLGRQVEAAVNRIYRSIPSRVEREDLVSEAWMGAIEAVDRFEDRGLKLRTFAEHRIRGRILDYLRRMDTVSRAQRRRIKASESTGPANVSIGRMDFADQRAGASVECFEAQTDLRLIFCRAKLKRRLRFVLVRTYRDGEGDVRVARELGVSPGRVSQLRNRAIRELRAAV